MSEETQPTSTDPKPDRGYYAREFWRVNFDKIILFVLIMMMIASGSDERLVYLTVGILGGAVTHNRWQRNP